MVNLYIIYQNMYYQSRKRKTCTTELFYYWNNSNRSLFQRAQRRDRHILVLTWAVSNQSIPTKEGGGNSAYWPNGTPSLFLYSPQAYNVFYISGWKKKKYCDMWKSFIRAANSMTVCWKLSTGCVLALFAELSNWHRLAYKTQNIYCFRMRKNTECKIWSYAIGYSQSQCFLKKNVSKSAPSSNPVQPTYLV